MNRSFQTEAHTCASVPTLAPTETPPPIRILRLPEVMERVGLKRASIYQQMAEGSFPKQVSLGARAVGWVESEVDAWVVGRIVMRASLPPSIHKFLQSSAH